MLVFSSIGFRTEEITVGNQRTVNVTMQEDLQLLDEVVVMGYSSKTRGEITLTFTSVTPGTTNVSWEIVGQTTGSGENFTYTFPKPGNYWVQMYRAGSGAGVPQ